MPSLRKTLTAEKALIFRVTHRANVPWMLENGLHCGASEQQDPDFVSIGNAELIERRRTREVPIPPGGTLEDYVPFYFTPFSPMLYNIRTGYGGIRHHPNANLVILVTSLPTLHEHGFRFVFTDRHAYLPWANYFANLSDLDKIDFAPLQRRDFQRDPDDPEKVERYQAEALVHHWMPASSLLGIACYTDHIEQEIRAQVEANGIELPVVRRSGWYFR